VHTLEHRIPHVNGCLVINEKWYDTTPLYVLEHLVKNCLRLCLVGVCSNMTCSAVRRLFAFAPYRHPVIPSRQYSCFDSNNSQIIVKAVAADGGSS
jgi:hypothetical protein